MAVGVTFLLVGDRWIVLAVMQIHIRIAHVARLSNFVIVGDLATSGPVQQGRVSACARLYVLVHMSRRAPALSVRTILDGRYLRWA